MTGRALTRHDNIYNRVIEVEGANMAKQVSWSMWAREQQWNRRACLERCISETELTCNVNGFDVLRGAPRNPERKLGQRRRREKQFHDIPWILAFRITFGSSRRFRIRKNTWNVRGTLWSAQRRSAIQTRIPTPREQLQCRRQAAMSKSQTLTW